MKNLKHPPYLTRLKSKGQFTGGIGFNHACSFCGKKNAPFGHKASMRKFLEVYNKGKENGTNYRDDSLLGYWTCGLNSCKEVQ